MAHCGQDEVDLVLSDGLGRIAHPQVKAAASLKPRFTTGLQRLHRLACDSFLGDAVIDDGIQAIPRHPSNCRPIWMLLLGCMEGRGEVILSLEHREWLAESSCQLNVGGVPP